jgi:hypothetical protein
MKIWYESEDGIYFEDEYECEAHEQKLAHPNLNTIVFFDLENEEYTIGDNILDEDIYQRAEKVIIHNERELNDFMWLADECGWSEFTQIEEIGEWNRYTTDSWSDGRWSKKN